MKQDTLPFEDRCRAMFMKAYELMLSSRDHAIFYVRYYSEQYRIYAMAEHTECYSVLVESLKMFFRQETDAEVLLQFAFESTINIVFRVASGDIENTPQVADRLLRLVYRTISSEFRDELTAGENTDKSLETN